MGIHLVVIRVSCPHSEDFLALHSEAFRKQGSLEWLQFEAVDKSWMIGSGGFKQHIDMALHAGIN